MYQLAKHLTNPYFVLVALLGLGLVLLWWRRRETKARLLALTVPYLLLLALSLPVVGRLALDSLENQYPPLGQRPQDTQAVVVLGGGQAGSAARCLLAAEVYHQGKPCPVLCTSNEPEAGLMREYLLRLGVREADLIKDGDGQNTFANAVNSRALLAPRHVANIVLVTDAAHMPRAAACFRRQGFAVVPAGQALDPLPASASVLDYLPNADAAWRSQYAGQEWLGMAWYRLRGRV